MAYSDPSPPPSPSLPPFQMAEMHLKETSSKTAFHFFDEKNRRTVCNSSKLLRAHGAQVHNMFLSSDSKSNIYVRISIGFYCEFDKIVNMYKTFIELTILNLTLILPVCLWGCGRPVLRREPTVPWEKTAQQNNHMQNGGHFNILSFVFKLA